MNEVEKYLLEGQYYTLRITKLVGISMTLHGKINQNNRIPFKPGSSSLALIFVILTDFTLSVAKTSLWRKKLQPSKDRSAAMSKTNARGYYRLCACLSCYLFCVWRHVVYQ